MDSTQFPMGVELFAQPEVNRGVQPVLSPIPVKLKPPRLFALLIGINKYKSSRITSLAGAVADALAVKSYLQDILGVPSAQIKTLIDEEATRQAIIDEMLVFESDSLIHEGDAIVIFYAGHGATSYAPKLWEDGDCKIQMLAPYDYDMMVRNEHVYGLPDRTIGWILDRIARKKGDNITVILDCCYSGSGTRSSGEDTIRVRGTGSAMIHKVPGNLDQSIWENAPCTKRGVVTPSEFLRTGLASHILLAACGSEERAREEAGRGVFTQALIETLIKAGADQITYSQLIERLPNLPSQSPQCEGVNRDRVCFDSKASGRRRIVYPVFRRNEGYVLEAGAAAGITNGAIFSISSDKDRLQPLGTLIASQPSSFTTRLILPSGMAQLDFKDVAFALQIRAGDEEDFRLHVTPRKKLVRTFKSLIKEMEAKDPSQSRIILVKAKEPADLKLTVEEDNIIFNISNSLVTSHGLKQLPFRTPLTSAKDVIYPILLAAAHYHWHLRRSGFVEELKNGIKIQFNELKFSEGKYDKYFRAIRSPTGPNLIQEGIIDFVVNTKTYYGITIQNTTQLPLYASVFFFDNSDLSIARLCLPSIAKGKVDAPLQPNDSLTIGYGSSGIAPIRFSLRDGHDIDVGFLKVFISTEPVDLSNIAQKSPFRTTREGTPKQTKATGLWHTLIVPIVVRRSPKRSCSL